MATTTTQATTTEKLIGANGLMDQLNQKAGTMVMSNHGVTMMEEQEKPIQAPGDHYAEVILTSHILENLYFGGVLFHKLL